MNPEMILLLGLLAATNVLVAATPTYTVVAPKVVRPNTDFFVAVSAHGIDADQDVQLNIRGVSDSGQTIEIRQATTVQTDQTQIVRLRIGDLGSGSYTLTASGNSPIVFDQTAKLAYVHKSYSIFIQTDKAIYRPGNVIKFRAIVANPQLKPSVVGSIDVAMRDGAGNLIREWNRVFTTSGVFAGELELAMAPVLGDWNLTVVVSDQVFAKTFLVAEYVLPKFEVDIDLPDYGTFTDGTRPVTIRANYRHGGPVKGEATISVFPKYKSSYLQPIFSEPLRKVVDISGSVDVEFDLAKELGLSDEYTREVVFDVHVKEDLTERIQNNTASVVLHKYDYKMELVKTADAFKPGMPYTLYLKVSKQDDTPIADDFNLLSVKWGYTYNTDDYEVTEYKIPQDGIVELQFKPPKDAEVFGIEGTYKQLTQWFSTIPRANSRSENYVQARLRTLNPSVGKNVKIGIESTEALASVSYSIFGRGKLVFAETLTGTGSNFNELNFRATSDMSPRCRVIAYYVRPDGEIVADSLEFEVDGALTNFIDIWASRQSAFPGSDVTVNVKAKPNSFVGIMAVDKSVRSLKSGHDVIHADVVHELRSYDSAPDPSFFPWFRVIEPKEGSLYWYTGSSGSRPTFEDSGAIVLTNGRLQQGRPNDGNVVVQHRGENRPFGRPLPQPGVNIHKTDKGPGVEYETATRPPLAGPYAFSRLPRPVDNLPKIYLKNDLPNTWLFDNMTTDLDGLATLEVTAPELANTSWIISGFSIDNLYGMGIAEQMQAFEVFQPFFVKVDLPYSVKKGETVAVQMIVYNYLEKEISAEVTLENPGGTSFAFGSKNPNEIEDDDTGPVEVFRTKRVSVKPGRGTLVSFIITPLELGLIDMKITAKSGSVGRDTQIKKLLVESEGEPIYNNTAFLLDFRSAETERDINLTINLPRTAVPGSEKVFISAIADPVAMAMNNLIDLLHYPTGCGEQNMLKIVPTVIVADYLQDNSKFEGDLARTAIELMQDGYQRQLAYKLRDGSFSAFGETDGKGSTWVTALVARYFRQASPFIDIDQGVIATALNWLTEHQDRSGAFKEAGSVVYPRMQESDQAMTAFVALAYMDNQFDFTDSTLLNSMNKAISYLASAWEDIVDDPYVLSIVTYVLHRADHPQKDDAFALLNSISSHDEGNKNVWWETQLEGFEKENPWTLVPNSINIEMTSYALMTLLLRNQFDDAVPVAGWLLSQQNENGGFASTSDTYVAVQALKAFSKKLRIPNRGADISVQYSYLKTVRRLQVKSEDSTLLQKRILDPSTRELRLRATGYGIGVVQVGYQYNLDVTAAWPSFVLNPQVFKPSTANHMQFTVCVNYIEGGSSRTSNMAVMEVNLPSGFTANMDSLPALKRYKGVKKVETEKSETKVVLYFEMLTRSEVCPTFSAYRTHRVANQKPAAVIVYDYYDQSRRARSFYDVVPATLCDICIGDDCPDDGCPDRPTFPTFGSYAYGENIDTAGDAGAISSSGLVVFGAAAMARLIMQLN
jgi:CD109 antigen